MKQALKNILKVIARLAVEVAVYAAAHPDEVVALVGKVRTRGGKDGEEKTPQVGRKILIDDRRKDGEKNQTEI